MRFLANWAEERKESSEVQEAGSNLFEAGYSWSKKSLSLEDVCPLGLSKLAVTGFIPSSCCFLHALLLLKRPDFFREVMFVPRDLW